MRTCPTCGQLAPSTGADLLLILIEQPDGYVFKRRDHLGWSATRHPEVFPDDVIANLFQSGALVAKWPGSEAGNHALTIPKYAMSRDDVRRRLTARERHKAQEKAR